MIKYYISYWATSLKCDMRVEIGQGQGPNTHRAIDIDIKYFGFNVNNNFGNLLHNFSISQ